jgi:hypothetical protein
MLLLAMSKEAVTRHGHRCDTWVLLISRSCETTACGTLLISAHAQEFWGRLREFKVSCVQLHAGPDPASGPPCTRPVERSRGAFNDAQMEMLSHLLSLLVSVQRLDIADLEGNVARQKRHENVGKTLACWPRLLSRNQPFDTESRLTAALTRLPNTHPVLPG